MFGELRLRGEHQSTREALVTLTSMTLHVWRKIANAVATCPLCFALAGVIG